MAPKTPEQQPPSQARSWAASLFGRSSNTNFASGSGTSGALPGPTHQPKTESAGTWSSVVGQTLRPAAASEGGQQGGPGALPSAAAPSPWDALMAQARLSKIDAISGKVHCLACRVAFSSYTQLAQHVGAKHQGVNSEAAMYLSHWEPDSPSSAATDSATQSKQLEQRESRPGLMQAGGQGHAIPKSTGVMKPAARARTSATMTLADLFKSVPNSTKSTSSTSHTSKQGGGQLTTAEGRSKKKAVTISFGMMLHRARPEPSSRPNPTSRAVVTVRGGRAVQARTRLGQLPPRARLRVEGAVKRKVVSTTKRLVLQHRADRGVQAAEVQLQQAQTALNALKTYQADLLAELDRLGQAVLATSDPGQQARGPVSDSDQPDTIRNVRDLLHSVSQPCQSVDEAPSSPPKRPIDVGSTAPDPEPGAQSVAALPSELPEHDLQAHDGTAATSLISEHIPTPVRIAALQLTLPRVAEQVRKAQASVQAAQERVLKASTQHALAYKLPLARDEPGAFEVAEGLVAELASMERVPTPAPTSSTPLGMGSEDVLCAPGTAPCLGPQPALPMSNLPPVSLSNPSSAMAVTTATLSSLPASSRAVDRTPVAEALQEEEPAPGGAPAADAAAERRSSRMVLKGMNMWTSGPDAQDSDSSDDDDDDDDFGNPSAGMPGWTNTLSAWGTSSQAMQASAAVNWSSLWKAPGPVASTEAQTQANVQPAVPHLTPPSSSGSANLPGALPALTARLHALQASAAATPSAGSAVSLSNSSFRAGHGTASTLDAQLSQLDLQSEGSQHGVRVLRAASGQMSSSDTIGSRASLAAQRIVTQQMLASSSSSSSGLGLSSTALLAAKLRGSQTATPTTGQQSSTHMAWPGTALPPRRETIGVRLQQQQRTQLLQHLQQQQQQQQQASSTGVASAPPGIPLTQILQLNATQSAMGLSAVQSAPVDQMHSTSTLSIQLQAMPTHTNLEPVGAGGQTYTLHQMTDRSFQLQQVSGQVLTHNLNEAQTSQHFQEELMGGSSGNVQQAGTANMPKRMSRAEMAVSMAMSQFDMANASSMQMLSGMHLPVATTTTTAVPVQDVRYWSLPAQQQPGPEASYVQLTYAQPFTSAVMGELQTETAILEHVPATWTGPAGQLLHEVQPAPGQVMSLNRQDSMSSSHGGVMISPARFMQAGSSSMGPIQLMPALQMDAIASRSVLELRCQLCGVQCNSLSTLQQHLSSKKHLTRMARQALAELDAAAPRLPDHSGSGGDMESGNQTYVGAEATAHSLCHQIITPELNQVVTDLLIGIKGFQDRALMKDPIKAAAHRWYVCGLREVRKACRNNKARSVIIAPNIEEVSVEGGLDDHLQEIIMLCEEHGIPVVFALTRKKMGEVYGHRKRVSAVAVLSFNGVDQLHASMVRLATQGALDWAMQRGMVPARQAGGEAGPSQPRGPFTTMQASGEAMGMSAFDPSAQHDHM